MINNNFEILLHILLFSFICSILIRTIKVYILDKIEHPMYDDIKEKAECSTDTGPLLSHGSGGSDDNNSNNKKKKNEIKDNEERQILKEKIELENRRMDMYKEELESNMKNAVANANKTVSDLQIEAVDTQRHKTTDHIKHAINSIQQSYGKYILMGIGFLVFVTIGVAILHECDKPASTENILDAAYKSQNHARILQESIDTKNTFITLHAKIKNKDLARMFFVQAVDVSKQYTEVLRGDLTLEDKIAARKRYDMTMDQLNDRMDTCIRKYHSIPILSDGDTKQLEAISHNNSNSNSDESSRELSLMNTNAEALQPTNTNAGKKVKFDTLTPSSHNLAAMLNDETDDSVPGFASREEKDEYNERQIKKAKAVFDKERNTWSQYFKKKINKFGHWFDILDG